MITCTSLNFGCGNNSLAVLKRVNWINSRKVLKYHGIFSYLHVQEARRKCFSKNVWLTYIIHHYTDVIVSAMASQITGVSIVCSVFGLGADQRNIKASRHCPLCREFTGDRWILRTKGQWCGKCSNLMTSSRFALYPYSMCCTCSHF